MARSSTSRSIPKYKRGRRGGGGSFLGRLLRFLVITLFAAVVGSVLWVAAYRFVNPPITFTMLGDMIAGRGAERAWMPISTIDRDMVRAAIGAEDSKFCAHHGFDFEAMEDAMKRNASGGRIRGGSTISQQTAKNAFLWQGGGYVRKGLEAWFTFLIENLWGKRRIMEVYLNLAETGIGTYGVNAGSERYYGHDASAMSGSEAARLAAILPLPKKRGAIAPKGFTRRYGNSILARLGVVGHDGLDSCVYRGLPVPANKAPPKSAPARRPQPGEEYETTRPLPPLPPAEQARAPADEDVTEPSPPPVPEAQPPSEEQTEPDQAPPPAPDNSATPPG
ncbi:monofunctional biosynthetic peptidoglycan transglycosylase [Sphingomonas ginkgonis]|uniref:Biosynthetic peptidoglycan transglycosylase n=1 Tax=Sphingomonas ginkgonis TaxID=2315330 RepID=A0A429VAP0_9SPHN|nr:monofunctional biosynthetic peptidoglycan transglycosylase [Sphingomonas ginkgonis]